MRPHAEAMPPVLCLQNGVDNEAALAEVLGAEKLISGTVTTAIDKPAAGQLVLERKRGVGLAGGHELSKRLYAAFEDANLNPRLYADAEAMKWSKLLANLIANATSAILDMSPAEIFAHPGLFEIEMRALREALAVMDVLGLQVVDLPGLPTRALAFTARRLPLGLSRPLLARFVGRGRGGKMPSLHIDLHTGRGRSEVGWLNGAVARHGERLGVATPVNRALTETLEELINNQTAKSLRTETLLAKLGLPS
jgi:2-dehydropantoate 2-reductase